jgi:hypothetical protein
MNTKELPTPAPSEDDVLRRMLATPPKPVKKPPVPAK